MLRAIIFDFNGVIVDDEPIHFELFQQVLAEEDIRLTKEDYYSRYLGFDDRGAFTAAYRENGRPLDDRQLARLIERKASYYREAIKTRMRVFPGVKTMIPALAQQVPLAIASGALKHEIREILSSIGLLEKFRTIVSAEDVSRGKPDPEIFLKALNDLNTALGGDSPISASDCLVIEDSKEGIRGARRAGMKCLAVTNSHPADLLKDADAVVESLDSLTLKALEALWL